MQTSVQMNCEPNADTVDMESEAQPSQIEPILQDEDNIFAAAAADEDVALVIALEEGELTVETTATGEETQTTEPDASENPSEPKLDSNSKSDLLEDDQGPNNKRPKKKKQDKPVRDGRKYVPSKKAMTDPLKMDMSKPPVIPLTSSQISLQCIECHIIFSDQKGKERHLKISHPAEYEQSILRNSVFTCYVCDRHFTNSADLMAHQKTHPEKKPFKCPICGQTYSKSSELTIHKKVHFGRDGYTCTDCGKPCKTLTLLKYHRRTHTGERPYVCKECGKRFTMSKALQKHMESHLPEGASPVIYPCFICRAPFKSTKTRNHHMKIKHNVSKRGKTNTQQLKQCTPIITPISISQPSLLQVGPNGPLQKVDANIDTEQIRKLIESLGNVQKVNQVVILGQVPPDAPPLEVQQISELAQPLTLNLTPTQVDFMGLDSSTNEHTLILEPITPDGQLLNPPFSALDSNMGASNSIKLTLTDTEHRGNPVAQVMVLEQGTDQLHQTNQMVCHNEAIGQSLVPENLDQTIVLELTPALTPTAELEQCDNVLQAQIPPSTTEQMNDLSMPPAENSLSEQETSMSVQSLLSSVELQLMPIQTDPPILPTCTFISAESLSEYQSEILTKDGPDALMENEDSCQVQMVSGVGDKIEEQNNESTTEQVTAELEATTTTENNKQTDSQDSNKEENLDNTLIETKQVEPTTDVPINVMSAQELVKVRKRKPPKAFFFQGYMQEFVSTIYNDDFQNSSRAAKRKRTKKPHLVVKFGPQSKEKKGKKTSKSSKQSSQEELKNKSPTQSKIHKKGKKDNKAVDSDCTAEIEVPASSDENDLKQKQKNMSKNKKKKQKVGPKKNERHIGVASPVLKKKQKSQSQNAKEKTTSFKQKKGLEKDNKKSSQQTKAESADQSSSSHIIQESLLLLKGHKQPQIKVHKLDPLKASGKTQEVVMSDSQTSPNTKDSPIRNNSSYSPNDVSPENKKKGGRARKSLTLLSSLHTSKTQNETLPVKPKTTRKRKASSKVETEGVITAKKGLECKDCGQRFSEVSLLQNHKTTVHIVESPGITFTNGNLFEGVSSINIYPLPKQNDKEMGGSGMGWDTEPEMADLDREHCVSFPDLNKSPTLPVATSELFCTLDDKVRKESNPDHLSTRPPQVLLPSSNIPVANKSKSSVDTEVQATTEEDIKENLLLEVDLVTVGEQGEKDNLSSSSDSASQNITTEPNPESVMSGQPKDTDSTSHTVSCSTHQVEIKEEEEETVIQKNQDVGKGGKTAGCGKQSAKHINREEVTAKEPLPEENNKQDDCEVVFEKPAESDNDQSDINVQCTSHKPIASNPIASVRSSSQAKVQEQTVGEQEVSICGTQANEPRHQAVEDCERDQSPGIILERVVTATHLTSVDRENNQSQLSENENQDIKVEDSNADSTHVAPSCAPHRDIRTVLVKDERRHPTNGHMRWNVEQNTNENQCSPLTEAMETTDSSTTQNFNSSQCIFYPVKEEAREVLVGTTESDSRTVSTGVSSVTHQSKHHTADDGAHSTQEESPEQGVSHFSDGQADSEAEWQTTSNRCDILLQSSDEEDSTVDMADSYIDDEEEIMALFHKKQDSFINQADVCSASSSNSIQEKGVYNGIKQPIQYFSKYFNWSTWREISHSTNKLTNMSVPVTFEEVAQFVGIHIAMGTLKYPSQRLYWEDLTKVPLVANAMPLSRFLELSRMLKLACPQDSISNKKRNENTQYHLSVKTDPLWKIQPILQRFLKGCRSLGEEGDYAVDHYPLPLTGKACSNKQALYCTTLISTDGMVLHVDLKSDPLHKEDVVEKLTPRGSMLFLCKQDLCTPAMLEHLLAAGIYGAGRVGGARGQIGDEFVSSDGKLTLRRSHCGFILSTTENGQRNVVSLTDNFEKAQRSARLNKDLQNLYSIPSSVFSPSCWPQTVLWFLIDLALVNSWLLYRQDATNVATPLTLLAFRLEVSKALIFSSGSDTQDSLPSRPETDEAQTTSETPNPSLLDDNPLPDAATRYDGSGHWPEQLSEGEGGKCRFGDCQRTSRVLCLKCCVFLCISRNHNCFLNFHNQGHKGKQ